MQPGRHGVRSVRCGIVTTTPAAASGIATGSAAAPAAGGKHLAMFLPGLQTAGSMQCGHLLALC